MSKLVFILTLMLLACTAFGQTEPPPLPDAPSVHRFFNKENTASFTALAGLAAVDSVSTQHILNVHHGRELNPIARGFVTKGWKGQMTISALGYGAALATAYTFHRTGHHKWERWSTRLAILAEMVSVTNNLTLNAHESDRKILNTLRP